MSLLGLIVKKRKLVEPNTSSISSSGEEKKVEAKVQQTQQIQVVLPPGAFLLLNFVTEEEERLLVMEINSHKWSPLMKREVQNYGAKYKYGRGVGEVEEPILPIPKMMMQMLLPRIQHAGYFLGSHIDDAYVHSNVDAGDDDDSRYVDPDAVGERMQEMIANKYQPGVGIGKHVDDKNQFGPTIISLSLLDKYVMDFEKVGKASTASKDDKDCKVSVLLPRRSLLILTGPSRDSWFHSIAPRKNDDESKITQPTSSSSSTSASTPVVRFRHARKVRISLTFRSLNKAKPVKKQKV